MGTIPAIRCSGWLHRNARELAEEARLFAWEVRNFRFSFQVALQKKWWTTWNCCDSTLRTPHSAFVAEKNAAKFRVLPTAGSEQSAHPHVARRTSLCCQSRSALA